MASRELLIDENQWRATMIWEEVPNIVAVPFQASKLLTQLVPASLAMNFVELLTHSVPNRLRLPPSCSLLPPSLISHIQPIIFPTQRHYVRVIKPSREGGRKNLIVRSVHRNALNPWMIVYEQQSDCVVSS